MKNKFSEDELLNTIKYGLADLNSEEIRNLIQKETDKDPDDINMDYIELCFRLLEEAESNSDKPNKNKKIHLKKPAKLIIIAAALIVVFVSAFSVTASNFNIPKSLARFTEGNADYDEAHKNTDNEPDGYALADTELAKKLDEMYGLSPITFPEELVKKDCVITNISKAAGSGSYYINAYIEFKYKGCYGKLSLSKPIDKDYETISDRSVLDVDSGQLVRANGLDVFIFERDSSCYALYKSDSIQYVLNIESDYDTAVELIKSIK